MGIGDIADRLLEGVESAYARAGAALEGRLSLGVTGLSGAGKTVFITALVASLLNRGRLAGFAPEAEARIAAAVLRPQPDPAIARFAYEAHVAALTGTPRRWPESTRSVSQIRVALRYRPTGFVGGLTASAGAQSRHRRLSGRMAPRSRADGAGLRGLVARRTRHGRERIARAPCRALARRAGRRRAGCRAWRARGRGAGRRLADYLARCRAAGLSALAPGRFLMPGEMAGSPALTFAPLPRPGEVARESLYAEMRRRFEAYKRHVVRPFFRDHFAALDRQVVLIDALGALAAGPRALADLTQGMADTLGAFRHGGNSWLDRLIGTRRIDRILFAASKADHLHHSQHAGLTALVEAMLAEAAGRARFAGAETRGLAIAAVRATVEQEITRAGHPVRLVRGTRLDSGREAAVFPGRLPEDPRSLVGAAMSGTAERWPEGEFAAVPFAPPPWGARAGDGPPHIRLDRALEALIGDRLE